MRCDTIGTLLHLIQFSDSALPVGGFSFSNTLESAVEMGLVHDCTTLEEFTHSLIIQAATTDGVAALNAHRAARKSDILAIIRCDNALHARKANAEQRLMSQRMGRKMAELGAEITGDKLLKRLCEEITSSRSAGTYAVVQGTLFAICHIGEAELFASLCYGTASMVVNAALRCMRITHRQTQQILYSLNEHCERLYSEVSELDIEQMHSFSPQTDTLSALHERATKRLFMN